MLFDDVRRLLAVVPDRLPATPRELVPVVLSGPAGMPVAAQFPDARRRAAVLLLIHAAPGGEARIVLTQRSPGDHRHAGQISLPGGAIEPGESAVDAALREAAEEVGLDRQQAGVDVAGVLPEIDVRVSGFIVQPVIVFAARPPRLVPDGFEVAAIVDAPLAAFLPGAPIEIVTEARDGYRLRYGAFPVAGHLVWGATAMLMARLGAFLSAPASSSTTARPRTSRTRRA